MKFIKQYKNAYTKEFCSQAIEAFEFAYETGLTQSRFERNGTINTRQDDRSLMLHDTDVLRIESLRVAKPFMDLFKLYYEDYSNEFGALKEATPISVYGIKLQKTKISGGYHNWHYESEKREVCHRVIAFTLYLNDVEDGGETEFLYQGLRIKPTAGTLCLFPAGFTHTHRGNPPLSNEKYIITGWLEL